MLACLAGKLLGALISGGIGSLDGGECPNDVRAAVDAEVKQRLSGRASPVAASAGANASGRKLSANTSKPIAGAVPVAPAAGASTVTAASVAGEGGKVADASAEVDWLQSPLLKNGLVFVPPTADAAEAAPGGDTYIPSLGHGIVDDGSGFMGPAGAGVIETFLRDLVEQGPESPAQALGQWVSKHVGENPVLARMGGPLVARGVRGAVAAMLWHSGYAAAAQRMAAALVATPASARARVDSQVPPFFLLETWRKAAGLKSWAKSRRDRGTPYEATAADLTRHCRFLLSLHPAKADRPVGWIVQDFKAFTSAAAAAAPEGPPIPQPLALSAAAPLIPGRRSPSPPMDATESARSISARSLGLGGSGSGSGGGGRRRGSGFLSMLDPGGGSLLRALETRHTERLSLVMGFLKGCVDLCRLRAAQLAVDARAHRRAAGLTMLRSLLGTTGREGSSGVKAALLLYVPPALRGVLHGLAALGPDAIALQVRALPCFGRQGYRLFRIMAVRGFQRPYTSGTK